jgi:hypothetical protein
MLVYLVMIVKEKPMERSCIPFWIQEGVWVIHSLQKIKVSISFKFQVKVNSKMNLFLRNDKLLQENKKKIFNKLSLMNRVKKNKNRGILY